MTTQQKMKNVTLYITSNSKEAYTTIPELVKPRERYVMVEYNRPAGDYEGWNIFTWNSGFGEKVTVNFQKMNGKNGSQDSSKRYYSRYDVIFLYEKKYSR